MRAGQNKKYEGLTMSHHEKLTLVLPTEAAEKLKVAADQENQTVATFIENVVDDWLERRRRDQRLGRTRRGEALPQLETANDISRKR